MENRNFGEDGDLWYIDPYFDTKILNPGMVTLHFGFSIF